MTMGVITSSHTSPRSRSPAHCAAHIRPYTTRHAQVCQLQPRTYKVYLPRGPSKRPRTHAAMAILPVSSPPTPNGVQATFSQPTMSGSSRVPIIFRRLHRFHQMVRVLRYCICVYYLSTQDFELAAWQLTYLCLAPKRV